MCQSTSTQPSKHSPNHSNILGLLDIETFSGSVTEVYKDDRPQQTVIISPPYYSLSSGDLVGRVA